MNLAGIESKKHKEAAAAAVAETAKLVVPKNQIHVTERAARKIVEIAEREGKEGWAMRVGIQGGGCSGLSYLFAFQQKPEARDKVFEAHGATVCIDPKSMLYLGGTVLDWQETLMRSGFAVRNPNEVKSCSCGDSFTI